MRSPGRRRRTGPGRRGHAALAALALVLAGDPVRAIESAPAAEEAAPAPVPVLEGVLRHFEHLDASRSLVEILPLLPGLDETERGTGRFLAGVAFAELGLDPAAERELSAVLGDPDVGGAAAVALARVLSRAGRDGDLLALARDTWREDLPAEDRGELAWRAARAAFQNRSFQRTERWIERIPSRSGFAAFGQYLRAQAAFARGRTAEAVSVAEGLVGGNAGDRALRDRAAILLGDLHTESGRYGDAARVLALPGDESPFAARATRDRLVAEGLARLAAGEFDDAEPVVDRVATYLRRLADEAATSVATPEAVEARVRELRGSWPPRFAVYARREWAADRARRALDAGDERGGAGGVYGAVVRALGRRSPHRAHGDPWLPPREPVARFFYPPRGEIDRSLRALALLEEPVAYHGDACRLRAATAIRERVARWLLDVAPPPADVDLRVLAGGCGSDSGSAGELARETRARLAETIRTEAERVRDGYRRDRLELELAIGRAWSRHLETIGRVRREASSRDATIVRP